MKTIANKTKWRRINSNFEPWIKVRKLTDEGMKITLEKDGGTYYYQLKIDEDGYKFISYGFDGPDQWWSSRCEVINKLFGINTTECAVKQIEGEYPDSAFAMGIFRDELVVPDCLELREEWGSPSYMLKEGIEFPRGNDYFNSTELDGMGNLIYPNSVDKCARRDMVMFSSNFLNK